MTQLLVDELFDNPTVTQTMNPVLVAQLALQAIQAINENSPSSRTMSGVLVTVDPDGSLHINTQKATDLDVWRQNAGTLATIMEQDASVPLALDETIAPSWQTPAQPFAQRREPELHQVRDRHGELMVTPGDQENVYYPGIEMSLFFAPWSTLWNASLEDIDQQAKAPVFAPRKGEDPGDDVHEEDVALNAQETTSARDEGLVITVNVASRTTGYICTHCGASSVRGADFKDEHDADWCSCGDPDITQHPVVYCENCDTVIFLTPEEAEELTQQEVVTEESENARETVKQHDVAPLFSPADIQDPFHPDSLM